MKKEREMTNREKASLSVEWICPYCNITVKATQYDLALSGIPVCPDCGEDMAIYEED